MKDTITTNKQIKMSNNFENKQIKMSNNFENVRIAIQELSELDCIVLKNIIQNTFTEKDIKIKCEGCDKTLEINETSSYKYYSGGEVFVCKDCETPKCMYAGCFKMAHPKDEDSDCWDCQGDNCNSNCRNRFHWNLCDDCFQDECGDDEELCIDCGLKPKYDDGVCQDCWDRIMTKIIKDEDEDV